MTNFSVPVFLFGLAAGFAARLDPPLTNIAFIALVVVIGWLAAELVARLDPTEDPAALDKSSTAADSTGQTKRD